MHRVILLVCVACFSLAGCESIPFTGADRPFSPPPTAQAESFGDYLSARLAASDHNMADASRLYAASLAADPDNIEILSRAFLYAAAAGDVATAARLAERVVQKEPDNRAARLAMAVAAISKGDYAAARADLSQSGKGTFTELTLVLLNAWASAGAGDLKSAEADLVQVVPQGGTEALMQFHRALILDLAGDKADAEKAYIAAVAAGGASPRIAEAFGRFLEREGRKDDAHTYYSKLQADAALQPMAEQGLARLASNEKPDRLVASTAEGAAEALFGIAASLSDQNSADVAVFYLRLALFLEPKMDIATIVLADRFEALDKYEDAIAAYKSLDHKSIYRAAAAVQIALDETKLGKDDEAIAELRHMTEQAPKDLTVWTALGDAYRNESKFVEAADAYNRAVALLVADSKASWPLYYARAIAEERSHHWDAAEIDLKHALQLSPDQPQVLNYLGYSWVDQGRNLPQALAMLEKARSLSPLDGYIVDSVGWAYYRLGRYADAVNALEAAIQLVPGDATVNEHLGDAYWKVGRKLDARFQWSHALAFNPDQSQKAEIEKKLQTGDVK